MNVVCILLDSLNRHFLPAYGNDWVLTFQYSYYFATVIELD